MPVAHLTLTVSHLATSTSFFLSCLQPLGYKFIGRHDNHVGFGSRPNEPADFWITEERPGVPAGAAHVAFPAPSQDAVGAFFIAALKAGGKIHGEPCMRDASQQYFSAAVIDIDGNSIEAVHQPSATGYKEANGQKPLSVVKNGSTVSRARSGKAETSVSRMKPGTTISRATETKTRSAVSRAAPTMVAKSTAKSSPQQQQPYQQPMPSTSHQQQAVDDGSKQSKAIIGTLVGAAAGAAIAYTMMRGDSQSETPSQAPQYSEPFTNPLVSMPPPQQAAAQAYRAIEAAPPPGSLPGNNYNAYSAYARSVLSKNPRASTIMEGMEYCCSRAFGPESDNGSLYQDDFGVRRASSASLYDAPSDMPIRAIEAPPEGSMAGSQYYQRGGAPTFISSFAERSRSYDDNERSGSVYSTSTVRPKSHHSNSYHGHEDKKSTASSHRSNHTSRSHHQSVITIKEVPSYPRSSTSSARNTTRSGTSNNNHNTSGGGSTIFLDVVDVDSHVTPVPQHQSSASRSKGQSVASFQSKASSKRSTRSSKFDEPVRPSDSVSQVSTNISKTPSKAPSKAPSKTPSKTPSKMSSASKKSGTGTGYGSAVGYDFEMARSETRSKASSRR